MPKMTEKQLVARDSKRDIGAELLQAARKLTQLDAAETLEFLRSSPGNRLEELDRDGMRPVHPGAPRRKS